MNDLELAERLLRIANRLATPLEVAAWDIEDELELTGTVPPAELTLSAVDHAVDAASRSNKVDRKEVLQYLVAEGKAKFRPSKSTRRWLNMLKRLLS